jgi:hypothetical protein
MNFSSNDECWVGPYFKPPQDFLSIGGQQAMAKQILAEHAAPKA